MKTCNFYKQTKKIKLWVSVYGNIGQKTRLWSKKLPRSMLYCNQIRRVFSNPRNIVIIFAFFPNLNKNLNDLAFQLSAAAQLMHYAERKQYFAQRGGELEIVAEIFCLNNVSIGQRAKQTFATQSVLQTGSDVKAL